MSSRSRPRPPSRPPTDRPSADARSLVVIAAWGAAVLALVWATSHPRAAGVAVAGVVAVGVAVRYVASSLARPVEWELSLRVPVVDCRVDVVFARPSCGE